MTDINNTSDAAQGAPVIGLSCTFSADRYSIPQGYINSLRAAGAYPCILPLPQDAAEAETLLAHCSGLLLSGGVDVDPRLYGEYPRYATEEICPLRDRGEFRLLDAALKLKLPVLGICRGLQVINVYFGGTLYQDIPFQVRALPGGGNPHRQSDHAPASGHDVTFIKTLWPVGSNVIRVNSFHHQAIKQLAPGFTVLARDNTDRLIEAIYAPGDASRPPVLAVQWHPELMRHRCPDQQALFDYFVSLTR